MGESGRTVTDLAVVQPVYERPLFTWSDDLTSLTKAQAIGNSFDGSFQAGQRLAAGVLSCVACGGGPGGGRPGGGGPGGGGPGGGGPGGGVVGGSDVGGSSGSGPGAGGSLGGTGTVGGVAGTEQNAGKDSATGGVAGVLPGLAALAAGGALPFTGFPVWAAVLVGLLLLATGLELRRRFRGPSESIAQGSLATGHTTPTADSSVSLTRRLRRFR